MFLKECENGYNSIDLPAEDDDTCIDYKKSILREKKPLCDIH